ncbi:glycine/betaine ABC transporter substrate-binding protein [Haloarcula sp. S1AR25-5A]|uniref:Glycine/betaine ABC transporter substrate-binding protein n=2 Tax=Haloarcula terrestris TaxID=2950533 RepID=A0AAE4F0U4_9EURY|nr:glycine/betaine ABC transporter substrate-binding protein [Haloarcula terrestris]
MGYLGHESLKANTDYAIEDEIGLGGSQQCFQAVKNQEVDLYHLYTGGAYATIPPKHTEKPESPEAAYEIAKQDMAEEHNLSYLERAQFNNTYSIALRPGFQEETGLETISGFAEYLNSGNTDLTVVLGPEFAERSDGWPGLTDAYGFSDAVSNVNIRKIGANLTYQVLGEGEAEAGMVFTTNPKIRQYNLATLEDDQNFFLPYNPAPLVNSETLSEAPEIEAALNEPMRALDSEQKVIELNSRISNDGEEVQAVARDFLKSEGII